LASNLSGLVQQLDTIARRQSARDRLSVEHIGRRPPENSLFR
jgi:hypothetical protein